EELIVKGLGALGIVSGTAQVDGCKQHPLRGKTWIEVAYALQALHEEASSNEQKKTERHLQHNQTGAEPGLAVPPTDYAGHFRFQRARQIDFTRLQGGNEAEQQSRDEANTRAEREDAPVNLAGQGHGHAAARGEK